MRTRSALRFVVSQSPKRIVLIIVPTVCGTLDVSPLGEQIFS